VDWFPDFHSHNYRSIADWIGISAAPIGIIRDEQGDIRWPAILGTVLSGVIIAGITALITLGSRTERIETITEVWLEKIEHIPEDIARLRALQETVLQRLLLLETAAHPATAKRFTADDAHAMEERLTRRIERLEGKRNQ
jgi:hypothetical protein